MPFGQFHANRLNEPKSQSDIASRPLPKSPVSSSQCDVVPQIIIRSPNVRPENLLSVMQKDFCNNIGTNRTSSDVRLESAFRGKGDYMCSQRVFRLLTLIGSVAVRCWRLCFAAPNRIGRASPLPQSALDPNQRGADQSELSCRRMRGIHESSRNPSGLRSRAGGMARGDACNHSSRAFQESPSD
jgi:hypothetical protein